MKKHLFLLPLLFQCSFGCFCQIQDRPEKKYPLKLEKNVCQIDTDTRQSYYAYIYDNEHNLIQVNLFKENKLRLLTKYLYNKEGNLIDEATYNIKNNDTIKARFFRYGYDNEKRMILKEWGTKDGIKTKDSLSYSSNTLLMEWFYYDCDKGCSMPSATDEYIYNSKNNLLKVIHHTLKFNSLNTIVFEYSDSLLTAVKSYDHDNNLRLTKTYEYDKNNKLIAIYWDKKMKEQFIWKDGKMIEKKSFYNENYGGSNECGGNWITKYEYYQ